MKYAVYSDIHSNLEAFEVVLKDINRQKVDKKIFLGDIVGYGPNPNECIEILKKNADIILAGNHDWAAVGKTDTSYFNPYAKESIEWTAEQLSKENRKFLRNLRPAITLNEFHIFHSTPLEPEQWHYIMTTQDAQENYELLKKDLCFIGHSHQPVVIEFVDKVNIMPFYDLYKQLEKDRKYIVNVGSVGQPRDANPDSCYLIYDSKARSFEYRRIEYNIEKVQKKMKKHRLPQYLIERLAYGR